MSHSSTEAEVISLDTGLRMEGSLVLTLRDTVIEVSEPLASRARGDPSRQFKFHWVFAHVSIFEDAEAVIKMIIKGRSLHVLHVSRTHRVNLDWL